MRAIDAQARVQVAGAAAGDLTTETPPAPLGRALPHRRADRQGSFVTLVEIVPPRGIDCTKEIEGARTAGAARRPRHQRARLAARLGPHERAEPLHPDSAAHRHRDDSPLHLPRPQSALHPVGPAGRLVHRPAQHPLPHRRSAQAGQLSRRHRCLRRGLHRPGQHRAPPQPRPRHRRQRHRRQHQLHHRRRRQSRRARHRAGAAPLRLQSRGRRRVRHHPAGLRPAPAGELPRAHRGPSAFPSSPASGRSPACATPSS